ncbi:TonB-like protein [Mucilaginibacter gracilis]|uniref:TonB-like protein n=1 Tax=Mucilaginibacter gracilis TaxID=423350 RepID=A0A495J4U8_9SPHI|nr:energy transducer TonB [Mucilaginibacter gracilis]RKR83418.1 TonB-like protein [Mucilaginibacter gracilis]
MRKLVYIILLICLPLFCIAQKAEVDTTVYNAVEVQPKFPGGEAALGKLLMDNVHYPKNNENVMLESRTVIQFIVEKDGTLTNFEKLKGADVIYDQIVNSLKKAPKWTPGSLNGKVVRVRYFIPIQICLGE